MSESHGKFCGLVGKYFHGDFEVERGSIFDPVKENRRIEDGVMRFSGVLAKVGGG